MVFAAALAPLFWAAPAPAQAFGRYTLGVQFAYLNTRQPAAPTPFEVGEGANFGTCQCGYPGFGVRFTAKLVGRLGVDSEVDFLPRRGPAGAQAGFTAFLAGPRLRLQSSRRVRVFAYLRPGLLSLRAPSVYIGILGVTFFPGSETDFVLNPGLSVELDIGRRWLARLDVGDLWITGSGCGNCIGGAAPLPANNPQAALGVAYRF